MTHTIRLCCPPCPSFKAALRLLASRQKKKKKKITPEMLTDELPLLVVVIEGLADLVSTGVTSEEVKANKQRATLIRRLIALGRAAGVVVIAATQKPQSDVVPTALRDLIQLRVGFATTNDAMTDTILGAGRWRWAATSAAWVARTLGPTWWTTAPCRRGGAPSMTVTVPSSRDTSCQSAPGNFARRPANKAGRYRRSS